MDNSPRRDLDTRAFIDTAGQRAGDIAQTVHTTASDAYFLVGNNSWGTVEGRVEEPTRI